MVEKRPIVYFFFGAPGSGKTTCIQLLQSNQKVQLITKETTREKRDNDGREITHVNEISASCDVQYTQYGINYGFSSTHIWNALAEKKSCALVVNDIRTLRLMKAKFGSLAKCIYVHSNVKEENIESLEKERFKQSGKPLNSAIKKRVEKIKSVHRKYIEHTILFDFTILNISTIDWLSLQLQKICSSSKGASSNSHSKAKLFIVCGASLSGKEELVNAMQQMEREHISNYQKATTRPKRDDDNNELVHFSVDIGIPEKFNIKYSKQGYEYGISTIELWEGLQQSIINMVVLNDGEGIELLKSEFGNLCTVLYLHADLTEEVFINKLQKQGVSEHEINKRMAVSKELFETYVNKMLMFDHVLLNTSEIEDLYDQAFNILDFYSFS